MKPHQIISELSIILTTVNKLYGDQVNPPTSSDPISFLCVNYSIVYLYKRKSLMTFPLHTQTSLYLLGSLGSASVVKTP